MQLFLQEMMLPPCRAHDRLDMQHLQEWSLPESLLLEYLRKGLQAAWFEHVNQAHKVTPGVMPDQC